jgi:hypothetical protein
METFRPKDSTDELSAFDPKHGIPEYRKVTVTGFSLDGDGVLVDVEGVGTYKVEIPDEVEKHANLTEGQVVVMDLMYSRTVRADVARILQKDAKAVLLQKRDDKKSA